MNLRTRHAAAATLVAALLLSACGAGSPDDDAARPAAPTAGDTPPSRPGPPGVATADIDTAERDVTEPSGSDAPREPAGAAPQPPIGDGDAGPAPVSARIGDLAREERAAPVRVRVPHLDVDAPVVPVGARDGELEVVDDVVHVGWYRYGPVPGEPGSAVLAAHVDTAADGPGVFFRLGSLRPGDEVDVEVADGEVRRFVVASVEQHRKDELPVQRLFARDGRPRLALITCGGPFDRQAGRYRDNVVVTADAVT